MKKYWFLFILLLVSISKTYADDISFVINAPASTVKGAQIQLQYILRGGNGTDIHIPDEIKGFDILFGPSVAQVYSSSTINGKTTSSESNITFTYVLMANAEGTFTLPAATIKANGKSYKSGTTTIKVLPAVTVTCPEPQVISVKEYIELSSLDSEPSGGLYSGTNVSRAGGTTGFM